MILLMGESSVIWPREMHCRAQMLVRTLLQEANHIVLDGLMGVVEPGDQD